MTRYLASSPREIHLLAKKTLALSLLWVSAIAIAQFISKSSLGGGLYWLGERPLSMAMSGVAKVDLQGFWYGIRSYSTFPHPNALAGFLVVGGLVVSNSKKIKTISNLALLSTFSLSAWIAKVIVTRSALYKTISLLVLLVIVLVKLPMIYRSLSLRLEGLAPIKKITTGRLLVGYGLGNSIPALANLTERDVSYRLAFQPVHNSFLLIVSEIGILQSLLLFLKYRPKELTPDAKAMLLVVLVTGLVDHYWITSHQNSLLLATLFGLFTLKSSG